jgi:predicted glutamine amidotransferase
MTPAARASSLGPKARPSKPQASLPRSGVIRHSSSVIKAMCQLLGMNANVPTDVCFSFAGLARRADEHKDGFGIAFFEDRGARLFVDAKSASESPVAQMVQHYPIKSEVVIAHIRKATQGRVALENTHPYMRELWGRYWVFAHNGDLKGFNPRLHAAFKPVGDTDSERVFCWLMQELAKAHASVPSITELSATLRELLPMAAAHGTFNMLLSNGQALWAHASTNPGSPGLFWLQRQHPFGAATLADEDMSVNFAAATTANDRVAVVATEPMTRNEPWAALPAGELAVFVGGVRSA